MSMSDNTFVYFEIPADDLGRARKFYEELLGWNIISMSEQGYEGFEGYWSVMVSDDFADLQGGMMERDELVPVPSFYIGVTSLDETVEKLKKLGGSVVVPKTPVAEMGWSMLFRDSEQNIFGLWQTNPESQDEEGEGEGEGEASFLATEETTGVTKNTFVHFEIPADDVERARNFYQDLLGWQFESMADQGFAGYWSVRVSDDENAVNGGLLERDELTPVPHFYINVESVDQTLEKVRELGGSVEMAKDAVPGMGWLALFKDHEGNVFGLWQTDPEAK